MDSCPVDATGQGDVPVTLAGETVVLAGGTAQIGSVTIPHVVSTTFSGNVTLDAGSKTGIAGNVTLSDAKTFIGLVTVGNTVTVGSHDVTNAGTFAVQVDAALPAGDNNIGNVDVVTNTAWSDPNTFIGLVTNTPSNTARSITGNLTITDSKGFIGLTTVVQSSTSRSLVGNVTIDSGTVSITGNVTVDQVDVVNAVTDITNPVALKGNLTLSDAKTYVGLVTNTPVHSVATVYSTVVSATGNHTIFVAPASNFFVVKDLILGSLGKGEVKFMEEGTDMIPYIGLSTNSGYSHHFGESGMRSGTAQKSFVAALNGAATISIHANVRFTTTT